MLEQGEGQGEAGSLRELDGGKSNSDEEGWGHSEGLEKDAGSHLLQKNGRILMFTGFSCIK